MSTGASVNVPQEVETSEPSPAVPIHRQPGLRGRVLQNTAANIAGRGLSIVFSAGAAVLLARYLGAEKLGQYGAIYAYLALFGWLATFGFEPVLMREISRERENASSLLHTAMVLSAFLSIGTVAAAVLVAPWAGYAGHLRALLILAGLEYVLTPLRLPAVIFQVDMRQWYGATINVMRQGLWFGIIVLLWFLGAPLIYVVAGRVLAAAVESWLMWSYSRRSLAQRGRFLLDRAGMIFSHSFPIAFTALLTMIYLRIDQVMLHKMVSDYVLGQYVAAVKVSELFEMLPSALMFAIAPILSVSVVDPQRFRSYTDRAYRYVIIVASALCVFISVGARLIVHLLYGRQFEAAAPLLAVLIWSEIAIFFAAVLVNVLIVSNQQRWLPVPTLIGAAVNVGLNLVLIPRYAAAGAAWASLISYTLAWMATLLVFRETRSVTWRGLRFALPIVAVALIATESAGLVPEPPIEKLFVSFVVFSGGILATKCLRVSDLHYVSVLVRESIGRVAS